VLLHVGITVAFGPNKFTAGHHANCNASDVVVGKRGGNDGIDFFELSTQTYSGRSLFAGKYQRCRRPLFPNPGNHLSVTGDLAVVCAALRRNAEAELISRPEEVVAKKPVIAVIDAVKRTAQIPSGVLMNMKP
jgi:hypothetical protein